MTILEASMEVLRQSERPLTAAEILRAIREKGLYTFGAKDPLKVLNGTIRKEVSKGDACRVEEVEKGKFRLS